jgi:CheY-like chemotaxis protein
MTATNESHLGRKALILCSDPARRTRLEEALWACGLHVHSAADGESGLERLLEDLLTLDVLVIDLRLDGRDAWSLLRLVRSAGGEQELPIVVAAEELDARTAALLAAAGADAAVGARDDVGDIAVVAARLALGGRPALRSPTAPARAGQLLLAPLAA